MIVPRWGRQTRSRLAFGLGIVLSLAMFFIFQNQVLAALPATVVPGGIIKCGASTALYYIGNDGAKYQFNNALAVATWDIKTAQIISLTSAVCKKIPNGAKFVTVAPASVLVKSRTSSKIYAVAAPNILRHITSPSVASALYGATWAKGAPTGPLRVFTDAVLVNYTVSADTIDTASEFDRIAERASCSTINECLGLGPLTIVDPIVPPPVQPPIIKCGDHICQSTETSLSCAVDCPVVVPPVVTTTPGPVCGNLLCEVGESATKCAVDCAPVVVPPAARCGDNICQSTESASSCSLDCGTSPTPVIPPASTDPVTIGISDPDRVLALQSFAMPALGDRVTYPVYNTTVRRITDKTKSGSFGTHLYNQLQAFSSDNKYVFLNEGGDYVVRNYADNTAVNIVNDTDGSSDPQDIVLSEINAPRWQSALPYTLVFFNNSIRDAVMKVQYGTINPSTNKLTIQDYFTLPSDYRAVRPNQSFDELSTDGRWVAGMASMKNGDEKLFAIDLQNRVMGAQISMNGLYSSVCQPDTTYGNVWPDWVGVSPQGKYLMVQWVRDGVSRCSGLETFDLRTGAFVGRIYDKHQHGSMGVDSTGEFFMTFDYEDSGDPAQPKTDGSPYISVHYLPGPATGVAPRILLTKLRWGQSGAHVSCVANIAACLVDTGKSDQGSTQPFDNEIFIQYTDGRVVRLLQHHSASSDYWSQPRASWSRDASKVIFATDLGGTRGEAYVIELPANIKNGPATLGRRITTGSGTPAGPTPTPDPVTPPTTGGGTGTTPTVTNPDIGKKFSLPASTYTLKAGETFNMQATGVKTFTVDPRMGILTNICFATDFIKHDIYLAESGATSYTLIGSFTAPSTGQFSAGSSVITNGCAKDRLEYTVTASTNNFIVADCITNALNSTDKICKNLTFGTPSAGTGGSVDSGSGSGSTPVTGGGTVSTMPQTTYTTGASTVNWRTADPEVRGTDFVKMALSQALGTGSCSAAADFIKYDFYLDNSFIGGHTGTGGASFTNGSTITSTEGCQKGTFIYQLKMSSGTHNASVCISNVLNTEQRYCVTTSVFTL